MAGPGSSGAAGAAPPAAGAGGAVVVGPCAGACRGETPVCQVPEQVCVECLHDGDCTGELPYCITGANRCGECTTSEDCPPDAPLCEPGTSTCVRCLEDTDCGAPTASLCSANRCAPCVRNEDCAHVTDAQGGSLPICEAGECRECATNADCISPDAPRCDQTYRCAPCQLNDDCEGIEGADGEAFGVCDLSAGEAQAQCVECTGADYEACGTSGGTPLVCNSLERRCSTALEGSAVTCGGCVSDAQCSDGRLCVEQVFEGQSVGYFCLYREDTLGDCQAQGRPYVASIAGISSVDGVDATVCGLAVSTCPARQDYRTKDCGLGEVAGGAGGASGAPVMAGGGGSSGSAGADALLRPELSLCGFAAPDDARCVPWGEQLYRCTMRCVSTDDCLPGSTCDPDTLYCTL